MRMDAVLIMSDGYMPPGDACQAAVSQAGAGTRCAISFVRCKLRKSNHYTTLGLDRHCTAAQIRAAYRALARQHHPDLNPDSPAAVTRTQRLNCGARNFKRPGKPAHP